jgi:hypothetical protein
MENNCPRRLLARALLYLIGEKTAAASVER